MPDHLPLENAKPSNAKSLTSGPLAIAKFLIDTFSTVRRRDPPPLADDDDDGTTKKIQKTCHVRLITISASHFCEKTRFVLDLLEARDDNPYYYTEDGHPPAFHAYETLKASQGQVSMTPMVIFQDETTGNTQMLHGSDTVNRHFMPELYPSEIRNEVERVEADLGRRLGATIRCFCYYHLLTKPSEYHQAIVTLCADPHRVAPIESLVFDQFLERGMADGMLKALGVHRDASEASETAIRQVFAEWSLRLEETGGAYLLDSSKKTSYGFTAADLTFAALASPLIRPPELKNWQFPLEDAPPLLRKLSKEMAATTAGQHVLKIYAKHRLPNGEPYVMMKSADRSKGPLFLSWRTMGVVGAATGAVVLAMLLATRRHSKVL